MSRIPILSRITDNWDTVESARLPRFVGPIPPPLLLFQTHIHQSIPLPTPWPVTTPCGVDLIRKCQRQTRPSTHKAAMFWSCDLFTSRLPVCLQTSRRHVVSMHNIAIIIAIGVVIILFITNLYYFMTFFMICSCTIRVH